MVASDESSVSVPAVTSPVTLSDDPSCSDVLAVMLPWTEVLDGISRTTGAVTSPLTVLPDASVNEFVATMSPVRVTGEFVVIVAPLIGPLIVACEAMLTVPVAVMLPVRLSVEPVPRLAVTAWMFAVSVWFCAPTLNTSPAISVPPVILRLFVATSPMFRSPVLIRTALPRIVRLWL